MSKTRPLPPLAVCEPDLNKNSTGSNGGSEVLTKCFRVHRQGSHQIRIQNLRSLFFTVKMNIMEFLVLEFSISYRFYNPDSCTC